MYTSILRAASLLVPLTLASQAALAQANPALDEAKRRLACGAGVPVSAGYLPNGSLQVTCRAPGAETVAQATAGGLPETGLSAGATAAVVGGALLVIVVADDDGTTTTTTTTD
ncbi:hypothetical protein [Leisingera sp. ANG59]|uniref:hypothetical protein n=1 Tax=Leisingera sp. ANG59 TaxID=2675221 RepID=UPI00157202D5|nr:hypothetical protein [Leisingera sp. ANG59]NSY37644.1 hypothetical protein [Leisingera sp. ANG59]